jgi:hypothetical protein
VTLNSVLAAEGADIAGVLGDFHLLHLLPEGGAISVGKDVNIEYSVRASLMNHCTIAWNEALARGKRPTWYRICRSRRPLYIIVSSSSQYSIELYIDILFVRFVMVM